MNWFAVGAGGAMVVLALVSFTSTSRGTARFPWPVAFVLGLAGLYFMYLGGALELVR
jgi:hypothetical protein